MEPHGIKRKRNDEEENSKNIKEAKYSVQRSNEPSQPCFDASIMPMNANHTIGDYKMIEKLGEGTFGLWYKARHNATNQIVAVKRLEKQYQKDHWSIHDRRHANISLFLEHKHLRLVFDVVGKKNKPLEHHKRVYLIAEYCDGNLADLLQGAGQFQFSFSERQAKYIIYQLLLGVEYLHKNNVMHRDIKPAKIYLKDGEIKLDMTNLIREYTNDGTMTPTVVTLWYRAPELLLSTKHYDFAIDMWSVGCIMAELFLGKPLFAQGNHFSMLHNIAEVLGPIRPHHWPELAELSPSMTHVVMNAPESRAPLTQIIPHLSRTGHELLAGLLCYNPRDRVSARQALQHAWFDDVSQHPLQYQQVHRSMVVLSQWL